MSLTRYCLGAAVAALAAIAFAQPPADDAPELQESEESGLSGLSDALDDLSDSPSAEERDVAEPEAEGAAAVPEDDPASPRLEADSEPSEADVAPAPASSAGPAAAPPPLSREERSRMEQAVARGRQLFALARAGSLATQDMLSRVADPEGAGIAGWVAEPEGNAMAVTFYTEKDEGPVAVYRSRILGGRGVSRETFLTDDKPPLTGLALRMAAATDASESEDRRACTGQPFNVLAVPPASPEEPVFVYRISAQESPAQVPLGGHYRSTVDSEGEVTESRAFSHGCLNVEIGEVPDGAQAGPIAVTHLLDPLPTEIHVFLSLVSRRPLVIAAGDPTRLFMVAGDSIREIRR